MVRTMSPKSYRTLPGMTVSRSMTQTALSVSLSSITLLIFVSLWTILTDYLEGDVYFKTKKERHNLHRARTQLRLVESMEEQMPEMEECVRKCFQTVNG